MTGLEVQNGKYGSNTRATKRAKIHGSQDADGPWTELLDLSWEAAADYPKETHTIPETTIGFLKLEIVEYHFLGPVWKYLRVLTGSKAI